LAHALPPTVKRKGGSMGRSKASKAKRRGRRKRRRKPLEWKSPGHNL